MAASGSDGSPEWLFSMAWVIWAASLVTLLLVLIPTRTHLRLSPRCWQITTGAILFGFIPILFHLHIYSLDYRSAKGDGELEPRPIWEAILMPSLPSLFGLAILIVHALKYGKNRPTNNP
jgi:hypothetical protein